MKKLYLKTLFANPLVRCLFAKAFLMGFVISFWFPMTMFAQAPSIRYATPQTYITGTAVSPLTPVNTGGAVPATVYGQVTTYAGTGDQEPNNGPSNAAGFYFPRAVATDTQGDVYVADEGNNIVRKITPAGIVSTFAGSGVFGSSNGTGTAASFQTAWDVATDAQGNVYVADPGNNLIRKITPAGMVTTLAGSGAQGSANGIGTAASFAGPTGVATDGSGNVYVADEGNNLIRKITPAGVVSTLAGSGVAGTTNGTGTAATFDSPNGLTVDGLGNVYVAEGNPNLIRKITPSGVVTTFAASGTITFANGTTETVDFYFPGNLATDANGDVFVPDQNNAIWRISPQGISSFLAGNEGGSTGSTNGIGSAASFTYPAGVATDNQGNVYVADYGDNLIRKVVATGYCITPELPAGLTFDSTTGIISGTPTVACASTIYTITAYNASGNSTTTVNITVRNTVCFNPLQDEVYGSADFDPGCISPDAINYTSSNTSVATIVSGYIHITGVGSSLITAVSNGVTVTQLLTVTPPTVTVTANNQSKTFGSANPLLTVSYKGFVNGDTQAVLTTQPTVTTTATDISSVGTYPIAASGAISANYTFVYVAGLLTVTNSAVITSAPNISYSSPQTYTLGVGIPLLNPVNSGGAIPAAIYAQVTTFAGNIDGGAVNGTGAAASFSQPYGIAMDGSGNIYVADLSNNLIRKITPGSVVTTLAGNVNGGAVNGTGVGASFNSPAAVAVNTSGIVYVADAGNNLIREITPAGVVTTLAGSGAAGSANGTGTAASFNEPSAVAIDASGNIYVTDFGGNLVRKITSAGVVSTLAGSGATGSANGTGKAASFNGPTGIGVDASGNVYVADGGNNLIRKITPAGVVTTLAGTGVAGSLNGAATVATFNQPSGVAIDASGNVYVADSNNNLIRLINAAGVVTTLAGNGVIDSFDGIGTSAAFNYPIGIVIDISGSLYIGDSGNNLIRNVVTTGYSVNPALPPGLALDGSTGIISGKPIVISAASNYDIVAFNTFGSSTATLNLSVVKPTTALAAPNISYTSSETYTQDIPITPLAPVNSGGVIPAVIYGQVTTLAGSAGVLGDTNGQGPAASFDFLSNLATDALGNIYAADNENNLIRKITPTGFVSTYAGSGSAGSTNGAATLASFNNPQDVTVDVSGNVYVADAGNNLIRKITPKGVVTTLAGNVNGGAVNGTGVAASFNDPVAIAVDGSDNVYVADQNNNLIRKITPAGVVTTLAGSGASGGANGTGTAASFNAPNGIGVDISGNVYVSDGSLRIRKITSVGVVTTLAGSGVAGSANGTGTAASFYTPYYLAVDPAGYVYVSDLVDNEVAVVRKISPAGVVTTLAGGTILNTVDGTGNAAGFIAISGVTADAFGNVYVAQNNSLLRKIVNTGYIINQNLPAGLSFDVTGKISGTPTAVTSATNYVVSAYNISGGSTATVSIATPAGPAGANLSNLDVFGGTLGPVFTSGVTSYTDSVSNTITSILVTPTTNDPAATVKVNGVVVTSGTTSKPIALNVGINIITTVVTASDGFTIKTYTITVTRAEGTLSTNATLSALAVSKGTLSPAFASGTTGYTDMVTNGTASITVTPTLTNSTSTVTVNGTAVASGSASAAIALVVGSNTITTVVTAQDGVTTDTYTVNVIRPSTNAKLAAFAISSGTLTPVFNTNTTSYTASVTGGITSITVTPAVAAAGATVKINGTTVASGSASGAIALAVGSNTITTVVTAQDGVTTDTYTLTVTRASASSVASLSSLVISKGTLTPAFATATTTYTDMVTNGTASVTITPTVTQANATVKVNGTTVASGSASAAIALAVGSNTISTVVTAQDGVTTKTYTITVIRPSTNAKLSALAISAGTLTPVFNTNTTTYTIAEPYTTSSIKITPTVTVTGATVKVNGVAVVSGSASGAIVLAVGSNTITIVVTAQDGVTTDTYTMTVTRAAGSADDILSALAISKGTLTPAFVTTTTSYTDMVTNGTASVTVTPTLQNATATLTVNGTAVTSGTASGAITLAVGINMVSIVVTAQTGVTKTYSVAVIRPSINAKLSALTISSGTLTPTFNTNTTSYTASVTSTTSSIKVTPTVAVTGATIKVNGTTVASGNASATIPLSVGSNTVTTIVTAQDGVTTDTYTITVTRPTGLNIPDATVTVGVQNFDPFTFEDGINVHQGLSPNGDGINDYLQIDNISNYPDNKLSIMNRNGQLVYEAKGYDNATRVFDGHSNKTGQMQLPGTYFYSLDYTVNGIIKHKTGFLVLKY